MADLIRRLSMAGTLSLLVSCTQNHGSSEGNSSRTQETGRDVFEQKCAACHGTDGSAGIANAANLQQTTKDSLEIINIINDGERGMPAFHTELTKAEIAQVAAYVKTLSTIAP